MAKFIELHLVDANDKNGYPVIVNADYITMVEDGYPINGQDTTLVSMNRNRDLNVLEPYSEIMGILRRYDILMEE